MKTKTIVSLAVFFGAAIFLFFWQRFHWNTAVINLKGERLEVLVAENLHQQYRGLGKRESLYPYDGMLFPFDLLGKPGIVMRDMSFAIDIIWLDHDMVVDIVENVPPEAGREESELTRYYPDAQANIVLELPAGWVAEHGLTVGDNMTIISYK